MYYNLYNQLIINEYYNIVLSSEPTCAVAEGGMLLLGIFPFHIY